VSANIKVTPGEGLTVYVGGAGGLGAGTTGGAGGFNGGGRGGDSAMDGSVGGGGGASDVRQGGSALGNRVVVAAGGGGAGYVCDSGAIAGGEGGTPNGKSGAIFQPGTKGGAGATQSVAGQRGGLVLLIPRTFPFSATCAIRS
jgi:hypothetical protein